MANLIQIKRSTTNAAPAAGGLRTGELAYSLLNTSNSLFVGDGSNNAIRVGGGNYLWLHQSNTSSPGALTANAVVIVNGNSFVTNWKTNALTVGVDGATISISNITSFANQTQLGATAGGSNTELATTYAIKQFVSASAPVQTNTYVSFGANSFANGGVSTFTFDSTTSTLSVGNTTISGTANINTMVATSANVSGLLRVTGNTVIGANAQQNVVFNALVDSNFIPANGASYNLGNSTFTWNNAYVGTVVAGVATVAGLTTTQSANVTSGLNVVGAATVNGALTVNNTAAVGNLSVTGTANVTVDVNVGANVKLTTSQISIGNATVNTVLTSTAFTGNAALTVGNTTINGTLSTTGNTVAAQINATSINVSNDLSVGGNLTVSGTLTTINTINLNVSDPLISLANGNATADISDIGFFGAHGNSTVTQYTGLFRKFNTSTYKLFDGLTTVPTTTVDTTNASFSYAMLQSHLSAGGAGASGFIANATTVAITANATLNVAIAANTLTLSTPLSGTSGGLGLNTFTTEDILVANSSNGFRKLGVGSEGYVLQVSSGVVAYNTLDGGTF